MSSSHIGVISWRVALLVAVACVALASSSVVPTVGMACCVLLAFMGPVRTLQALMVSTLITYSNPHIVKHGVADGVLFRVVLIAAVLRVMVSLRLSDLRLVWPVWLFALTAAATSTATSQALPISLMKIAEFTFATTAVLIAFNHLKPAELARLQSWFITVGITVIGLSALTLLKPGFGAGLNGGLQGILNQPQALGIFIAPFAAWAIAGVLLMRRRASALEIWIALGTVVLIVLTRARTAGVATFIGVAVVMLAQMLGHRSTGQAKLGRAILVLCLAIAVLGTVAVSSGKFRTVLAEYAFKGTERDNRGELGDAFYESRGGGVLNEWHHFLQQPVLGNGFGVYPNGKFPQGVVMFYGIPISAPIEKGFLPTAVLEEDGLLGGILLTLVIAWLARYAWRCPDLRWRAMFVACLAMNIGECVFLSPGGIGLFDWLLVGLSASAFRALPVTHAKRVTRTAVEPATPLLGAPG